MRRAAFALVALLGLLVGSADCAGWLARSEGLDVATIPDTVRPDYDLFALRCSKCHSLARPLSSGIDDDDYWAMYVARMRRQPGSGISLEDTVSILRFLHYYSEEQIRRKGKHEAPPLPPPAASDAPPAAPAAPPASAPTPAAAPAPAVAPPAPVPATPPVTSGSRAGGRRRLL
jgi:hypothetical protein